MHNKIFKSNSENTEYNIMCKTINIYCANTKESNRIAKNQKTKRKNVSQQNNIQINFNLLCRRNNRELQSKSTNCSKNYKIKDRSNDKTHKNNHLNEISDEKRQFMLHDGSVCSMEKSKEHKKLDSIKWLEYLNYLEEIQLPVTTNESRHKSDKQSHTKDTKDKHQMHAKVKKSFKRSMKQNAIVDNLTKDMIDFKHKNNSILEICHDINYMMSFTSNKLIELSRENITYIIQSALHDLFIVKYLMLKFIKKFKCNISKILLLCTIIYFNCESTWKKYISNIKLGNIFEKAFKYCEQTIKYNILKIDNNTKYYNKPKDPDPALLMLTELKEMKEILKSCKLQLKNNNTANDKLLEIFANSKPSIIESSPSLMPPPPPPPLPSGGITPLDSGFPHDKKINCENLPNKSEFSRPLITVEALKSVQLRKVSTNIK